MSRARLLRRLGASLAVGVGVGLLAWLLGMDAGHAIGLGAVLAGLVAGISLVGDQADVVWPLPPAVPRAGSRRDIPQLGWSLAGRARGLHGARVSSDAVRRLRTLAEGALALRGIALDDPASEPAVRVLLGDGAPALLRRGSGASPSTAEFVAVLGRLEQLGRDPGDGA
jgi:hypothetical protein